MKIRLLALSAVVLTLTGCAGIQTASKSAPTQFSLGAIKGNIHGGQNPVGGSAVQVYAAGTTGTYGTAATALIPTANAACTSTQSPKCYYLGGFPGCVASGSQTCYTGVISDAGGNFSLNGDYSCTSSQELYITATGGNPGSGTNNSLTLMTAIGLCSNLPNVSFVQLNEVTTVGTVWALAPFMSDSYSATTQTGYVNIGAPSTNVAGLQQAFMDVNTLINYQDGYTPGPAPGSGATVPSGAVVPVQEIFAIADALAACVNTSGGGACTGTTGLFTYTTVNSVAPTDIIGAALNIANNPGVNATPILALKSPSAPWATTFTTANDLTLAVTYTGGGSISSPSALAVDAAGNVWIANSGGSGSVTELGHNGAPAGTFTAGSISTPTAIAVDTSGDIWVANGNSTLTELSSLGTNMNSGPFSGGGLSGPTSISFDGLGNVWLANYSNSSVSEFSSTGSAISGTNGYTASGLTSPIGVAINPH
jgi:hypothetical protein